MTHCLQRMKQPAFLKSECILRFAHRWARFLTKLPNLFRVVETGRFPQDVNYSPKTTYITLVKINLPFLQLSFAVAYVPRLLKLQHLVNVHGLRPPTDQRFTGTNLLLR